MRSLFIVSLPRSLSSLVYHVARRSLGVGDLSWTSDGELLNPDRHASYGRAEGRALKYTRPWAPERRFARMHAFLDAIVRPEDHVYKDVVQPFVVSSWLEQRELAILCIRRPLADVVFAMQEQGWTYPARAVAPPGIGEDEHEQAEAAVVAGLIAARRAFEPLAAEVVDYDDLVSNEAVLPAALARLYPGQTILPVSYLDEFFNERRAATLARRSTQRYRELERRIARIADAEHQSAI